MSQLGLIITGHILLSDKNPRKNVTKTTSGAELVFVRQQYMTMNDESLNPNICRTGRRSYKSKTYNIKWEKVIS